MIAERFIQGFHLYQSIQPRYRGWHMMMTREEMVRLAELARLELASEEMDRMSFDLDAILQYVGRLAQVDTTGIPEEGDQLLYADWRSDEACATDEVTRALIKQNFPEHRGEALSVPAIFDRPKQ